MSSVFAFDDVEAMDAVYAGESEGYVYSRMTNHSTDCVERILAQAEECDGALCFHPEWRKSLTPFISQVKTGDHISLPPFCMVVYMIISKMNFLALA